MNSKKEDDRVAEATQIGAYQHTIVTEVKRAHAAINNDRQCAKDAFDQAMTASLINHASRVFDCMVSRKSQLDDLIRAMIRKHGEHVVHVGHIASREQSSKELVLTEELTHKGIMRLVIHECPLLGISMVALSDPESKTRDPTTGPNPILGESIVTRYWLGAICSSDPELMARMLTRQFGNPFEEGEQE